MKVRKWTFQVGIEPGFTSNSLHAAPPAPVIELTHHCTPIQF